MNNYEEVYLLKIQEICGNKLILSKDDICNVFNISLSTLNRRLKIKTGIPKFDKISGSITFRLHEVVKFLLSEAKL